MHETITTKMQTRKTAHIASISDGGKHETQAATKRLSKDQKHESWQLRVHLIYT